MISFDVEIVNTDSFISLVLLDANILRPLQDNVYNSQGVFFSILSIVIYVVNVES